MQGYTQPYMTIHSNTCLYTAIHGYTELFWPYIAVHSYAWLYTAIHSYTKAHENLLRISTAWKVWDFDFPQGLAPGHLDGFSIEGYNKKHISFG